jgi:sterol desaturase/sphingolipid hydroxylase (fatty acid hydroxylase superfamily)
MPATILAGGAFLWACNQRRDIALALVILGVVFTAAERLRPLRRQPAAWRRPGAGTDAVHFVVDEILAAAGLAAVLVVLLPVVRAVVPDEIPRFVRSQPTWLSYLASLLFAEVAGYWGHRLTHEVPGLWRFHRIHHSSPTLDWLSPNRRHPVDQVFARVSVALPTLAMGFAVPTLIVHFAIKRAQGLFVHANLDLDLGRLEQVVATPHFHHWHHSAEPGTWNKNYAGQMPLVDRVFGTYYMPDRWPDAYGCEGYVPPQGYVAQLLAPWSSPVAVTPDQRRELDDELRHRTGSSGRDGGSLTIPTRPQPEPPQARTRR